MTDMSAFELRLASSLEHHLGPRRRVDAHRVAQSAMAPTGGITLGWRALWLGRIGGRPLTFVAIAAALLIGVLLFTFFAGNRPAVLPQPSATPSASESSRTLRPTAVTATTVRDLIPIDGPYAAVITRRTSSSSLDVFVFEGQGERRIASISVAPRSLDEFYQATVSMDGWLYVSSSDTPSSGYVDTFYDLSQGSDALWTRPAFAQATSPKWGPNGLLATDAGNTFLDPRTEKTWTPADDVYLGGGPVLLWSADGVGAFDERGGRIGVQPADGSPFEPGVRQSWQYRGAGLDGNVLCDWVELFNVDADCGGVEAGVAMADGSVVEWANGEFSGETVYDSSFAADGESVWTIANSPDRNAVLNLDLKTSPGHGSVTTLSADELPFEIDAHNTVAFAGFAPDDSVVVVAGVLDGGMTRSMTIVADSHDGTIGYTSKAEDASLAGFVPESLAATWLSLDQGPTAAPATPGPDLIPVTGPYAAVVTRHAGPSSLEVFVLEPDGTERLVRRLTNTDAQETQGLNLQEGSLVSADGWLAVPAGAGSDPYMTGLTSFYDLSAPARTAWTREHPPIAATPEWGPTGLYAIEEGNSIVDPRTQTVTSPSDDVSFGAGPFIYWSADGSGLFTNGPGGVSIAPVDGGPAYVALPATADRYGGRDVGLDGVTLCEIRLLFLEVAKPECDQARIGTTTNSGPVVEWGTDLPDNALVKAVSFASDRRSLWALVVLDQLVPQLELRRYSAPGQSQRIATFSGGTTPFTLDRDSFLQFRRLAPDDSVMAIAGDGDEILYVNGDQEPAYTSDAALAGYVPSSLAESWPTVEAP